jgi:diketogulonate reductase-like aldo/keto reductase
MRTRTVQHVTLPSFMYGTAWKEERTEALAREAITAGFRAIDTANQRRHYFEAGVGAAVAAATSAGEVTRDDLFLQTKFTYRRGQDHRLPYDPEASPAEQVSQSFASSLEHLSVDHLDSYVLHGPSTPYGFGELDRITWQAMEEQHRAKRTRLLGISNVSLEQLQALVDHAEVAPAFVQNRCFARNGWDSAVRAFCQEHDILYQGFSLLTANRRELATPAIAAIAERTGLSLPQLVFRFALQVGMVPLTGTTDAAHMRHDLEVYEQSLDAADVDSIERVAL